MGGDDEFYVRPYCGSNKTGTVKIDGGAGNDEIDTARVYEGTECFITGGGPERDTIYGGRGNDLIYVENDTVTDFGGENTFVITGSGDDLINVSGGDDVIIINKTSGSIRIGHRRPTSVSAWRSVRIIYQGDSLTSTGTLNDGQARLRGGRDHHDVLSMTKYHPIPQSSSPQERMIVLLFDALNSHSKYTKPKFYFEVFDDVADHLFENTRCTRNNGADPPVFCPEAYESHQIFYKEIERFELCRECINLLFLTASSFPQLNTVHEIIGGPLDDYIINSIVNISIMAQMGSGANRVFSGNASDSYSLILDDKKDIIYDKGGDNMVAVMLPEGLSFGNVYIGTNPDADSFLIYHGTADDQEKEMRLEFGFREESVFTLNRVKFLFKERTGKEIVFKSLVTPSHSFWLEMYHGQTRSLQEFYSEFVRDPDWAGRFVESVTPASTK